MRLRSVVALGCLLVACRGDARRDGPPPAGSAPTRAPADEATLAVTLDDRGVVAIGTTRLLVDDAILAAFRAFHEHAPRGKITIFAHRATLHGRLVRIVDLAKDAEVPFDIVVEER